MQATELYNAYLRARSAYDSYVRPDPELLAATAEADRRLREIAQTWDAYYRAKYPDGTPEDSN